MRSHIWTSLGFKPRFPASRHVNPLMYPHSQRASKVICFNLADRIRLLVGGKLHLMMENHSAKDPGVIVTSMGYEISPPGTKISK